MNMDLTVTTEKKKYHLHCVLVPEKEIEIDAKHHYNFVAVKVDDKISIVSKNEEEIIKPIKVNTVSASINENDELQNDEVQADTIDDETGSTIQNNIEK